jgi:hypothetical protein
MKLGSVLFLFLLLLISLSCADHDFEMPTFECTSSEEISYDDHVHKIVQDNCAIPGCHNGANGAERDWRDFQKFQAHAKEVKRRISLPEGAPDHMPRTGELTKDEIQTIVCWVDQGAKDN